MKMTFNLIKLITNKDLITVIILIFVGWIAWRMWKDGDKKKK